MVEFYSGHPTPTTAWRLAVLMGANTRTYKFALGTALLEHATQERREVTLEELATPYAMALLEHAAEMPQARSGDSLGEQDYLSVLAAEAAEARRLGTPTERLLDATVRSMPGMVMQKFHNLAGSTEVPHRFYELTGRGRDRRVRLTDALERVAISADVPHLSGELDARWRIVETSFASGVGASLMRDGLAVDSELGILTDRRRRRSVAGVEQAVGGFQHQRCLTCWQEMSPGDRVAIDHVFPFSLTARGLIAGEGAPDLDAVWNLAPGHYVCNAAKSSRMPTAAEVRRLAERNVAIMNSPHPLKRTLELSLRAAGYPGRPDDWYAFLRSMIL